jgi:2-oxoisovalerate dehydrogenase E2 component (dihydrolipoyl transacylase)
MAAGVKASPSLNAWFHAATGTRTLHEHIHLGMAVETDDGLFVPVIRDAANQDPAALRAAIDAIKDAVAQRSIAREDMTGQTITLSNFGMFGGRYADLVVMPPQVAILGAGRAQARAVVVDGQIVAHRILPLSLTFDHRVVTGVEAARFLNSVIEDLQRTT